MDLLTLTAFAIAYLIALVVPGPGVAAIVRRLKEAFDPKGILNPGRTGAPG